jgi:uncharacterized protein DUF3124
MPIKSGVSDDQRYSMRVDMRLVLVLVAVLVGLFAIVAYNRRGADSVGASSASERLQPVANPPAAGAVRRTVYVPIYSSLDLGLGIKHDVVQLTSTLSVRNVSPRYPIVIESVRYYDSHGRLVREHLDKPAELAALASVEFVVRQADTTGGPGANFLVRWSGTSGVDEPLLEAVMLGRSANAWISFTSVGRAISGDSQ